MTVVLGEMAVARVKPAWPGRHQAQKATGSHPASQQRPPTSGEGGGDSRSVSYPMDDFRQSRITLGVGGWGMNLGEDKKRDRLIS